MPSPRRRERRCGRPLRGCGPGGRWPSWPVSRRRTGRRVEVAADAVVWSQQRGENVPGSVRIAQPSRATSQWGVSRWEPRRCSRLSGRGSRLQPGEWSGTVGGPVIGMKACRPAAAREGEGCGERDRCQQQTARCCRRHRWGRRCCRHLDRRRCAGGSRGGGGGDDTGRVVPMGCLRGRGSRLGKRGNRERNQR